MRPFTVDDLLKLNQFAHRCPWDLSPDGALLAVTLSEANRREPLGDESSARTIHGVMEANGAHLLLLDTATGESIVPFPDASMSWAGRWSPDGQTLAAFVVAPQTQACVGLWDRRTREVRLFRDAAVHCGLNFYVPQWTPDGLRIVVRLVPEDTQATVSSTDPDVIVRSYDPKELDADQNQPFFQRQDANMCVGVVDVQSGAVARYGAGLKFNIPRLAPNGRAVALLNYIKSPVGGRSHYVHDLLVVPIDGREPHIVAKDIQVNSYASCLSWSPDSEMICFVTELRKNRTISGSFRRTPRRSLPCWQNWSRLRIPIRHLGGALTASASSGCKMAHCTLSLLTRELVVASQKIQALPSSMSISSCNATGNPFCKLMIGEIYMDALGTVGMTPPVSSVSMLILEKQRPSDHCRFRLRTNLRPPRPASSFLYVAL